MFDSEFVNATYTAAIIGTQYLDHIINLTINTIFVLL